MEKKGILSKLICVTLVVIISINKILPSICYGEEESNTSSENTTNSIYDLFNEVPDNYDADYSEEIPTTESNVKNIIIQDTIENGAEDISILNDEYPNGVMAYTRRNLMPENDEDNSIVAENEKTIAHTVLFSLLEGLKDSNGYFSFNNLSDENKDIYFTVVSDIRYYHIMREHFGAFGAYTYIALLQFVDINELNEWSKNKGKEEDYSWLNKPEIWNDILNNTDIDMINPPVFFRGRKYSGRFGKNNK